MKKSIITLAVLSLVGCAAPQYSVQRVIVSPGRNDANGGGGIPEPLPRSFRK
jgi:hypothetical protein